MREREYQRQYNAKQREMYDNHPDRLSMPTGPEFTSKEKLEAVIKEATEKGYTFLPADPGVVFVSKDLKNVELRLGLVIYKEIDGVELAYNPIWSPKMGFAYKFPKGSSVPKLYKIRKPKKCLRNELSNGTKRK